MRMFRVNFSLTITDALLRRGETRGERLVLLTARHQRRHHGTPFASRSVHSDGTKIGKRRVYRHALVDFRKVLAYADGASVLHICFNLAFLLHTIGKSILPIHRQR